MKFWKKLLNRTPKNKFPEMKHVINYAFTCGGIKYFQFDDMFNLPYERCLKALVYYQEVKMNCTREFLQAHQQAINNILTSSKIDIYSIKTLNDQLGQRLDIPPDTELLYKLASVVFFDEKESPTNYEFPYGQKKIDHWKKHSDVHDFFLQRPMLELMPFLNDVGENLNTFHGMMQTVNQYHLGSLSEHLSEEQKIALNIKSESSPEVIPQK
jgi:hypothetical protein